MTSTDKRTLLVIGAGLEGIPGIKLAHDMGLHVVVTDRDRNAPGFTFADDTLLASTYDVDESRRVVRDYHTRVRPIDGVMCIASDVPHTVAAIAEDLSIPGIPRSSAETSIDKLAMKECFAAAEIPIPWFRAIESVTELQECVKERGYPLVIKPVDSRGSRGVLLLKESIDLNWAFTYSRGYSPTGRVMLERFLEGPQISTESILLDGIVHTPGLADRNYEELNKSLPHIVEDGGDLPSLAARGQTARLDMMLARAGKALGIKDGVLKGDVVIHKGEPAIIEMAARLSGGYFCTHEIPLNTGVDFVKQAIKLALGDPVQEDDLTPKFNHPICQRYLFPEPGRVTEIRGDVEVSSRTGTELCELRTKPGALVGKIHNHPARAGVVITSGNTREEARDRAMQAVNDIKIITVPA